MVTIIGGKQGDRMRHIKTCFDVRNVIFSLLVSTTFPSLADTLHEGEWSGSYTLYNSDTLDVLYDVQYSDLEENKKISITMIIDIEPQSDFTYLLEDVVVDANKIAFKIKKPQETKSCELFAQDNGKYLGQCQSDLDTNGKHLTEILMIPPSVTDKQN